jgi:hypothetical protein
MKRAIAVPRAAGGEATPRISLLENRPRGGVRPDRLPPPARRGVYRPPARSGGSGRLVGGTPNGWPGADRLRTIDREGCLTERERRGAGAPRRGAAYAALTIAILLLVWESIGIAHGLAILFGP